MISNIVSRSADAIWNEFSLDFIVIIAGRIGRFSYVDIPTLTFQFEPISICAKFKGITEKVQNEGFLVLTDL